MNEIRKPDPNIVKSHFSGFANGYAPDRENRFKLAGQLARCLSQEDTRELPSDHQGYNMLLAGWGSGEARLRHTYQLFKELSAVAEQLPLHRRVVVFDSVEVSKLDSLLQIPDFDAMAGPMRFKTGLLASSGVEFQYSSKLSADAKGIENTNIRSPYLLASAGIRLHEAEEVSYDIGSKHIEPSPNKRISIVALGATLTDSVTKYNQQNFAIASPIIAGDEACADFLSQLDEAYFIPQAA